MVAFLSFWDRLIRARSFYTKQRISSFEGFEKAKASICRHLRSNLCFKFEDGALFIKATEAGYDPSGRS